MQYQYQESIPNRLHRLSMAAGITLLLAQGITSSAMAAAVTYTFTGTNIFGPSSAALAPLAGLSVSGSFTYDADGALNISGASGSSYQGFSSLSGTVGGYSFSDSSGGVVVQNDSYTPPYPYPEVPSDLFLLYAEPTLGMSGSYNLTGFTVPGLTLVNVRLFWIENLISGTPDFLGSNDLPSALPTFTGRLALDFVASPYTPVDGQPSPTLPALSIVFFDGLTVSPVAAVPVPASLPLFASGLLGIMLARRRKLAA